MYQTQHHPPRGLRSAARVAGRLHRGLALRRRPLGPHGELHGTRRRRHCQRRALRQRRAGPSPQIHRPLRARTTDYYVKDLVGVTVLSLLTKRVRLT